jgi:predicted ATPase
MDYYFRIPSIRIRGYRPFKDTSFQFSPLQVIAGANGSGKSSLFEFLKFLRDACYQEIPPEIVSGAIGQQIFHKPGSDRLWWSAEIDLKQRVPIYYQGELMGPIGSTRIIFERVITKEPLHAGFNKGYTFLNFKDGRGHVRDPKEGKFERKEWNLRKPNQLGLGAITDSTLRTLFSLREFIRGVPSFFI